MSAADSIDPSLARKFTPIGQLPPTSLKELLDKAGVLSLKSGATVFSKGATDDWTFYVLEGAVELHHPGGEEERVNGGTDAARLPLAPGQPRQVDARVAGSCRLLRVSTSLLEVLGSNLDPRDVEVEELGETDESLENRLLFLIASDYARDRMAVPGLPDVVLRIRRALAEADVDVGRLERLVIADPAVAARLIRVANSPAYAGVSPLSNCKDAITRLGLETTRDLVTSLALKHLFRSESPVLRECMVNLWRHATRVAALSHAIARVTRFGNPEQALLAGLVHDVGALAVVRQAARYPELLDDPEQLHAATDSLRAQFGAMVMRRWNFPPELVTVALEAREWARDPSAAPDCCDLVLVAQLLGFPGVQRPADAPEPATLPAFSKLGLVDQESVARVLAEARASVSELQRALTG